MLSSIFSELPYRLKHKRIGPVQAGDLTRFRIHHNIEPLGEKQMKGLDLAEAYYDTHGAPMIVGRFGDAAHRIATGFVGPGSECFGFDDEISRDHDWGPGFCIWLPAADCDRFGADLQKAYENLPATFMGFGPRKVSPGEQRRTGVGKISEFYLTYTGLDHVPATLGEWLNIPESSLATCTNGKIFTDPLGEFSRWRKALLDFYPEDVRLKKLASRCFTIAQAGQYNFTRSLKRKEFFAARYSETRFCADVISLIFLLNKRYAPFYKWMHRAVMQLPLLGKEIHALISGLMACRACDEKPAIIEKICTLITSALQNEGLSDATSKFLLDHAYRIHDRIEDRELRAPFSVVD